jgi:[acyl-carrier-protein] S-malonyltransferase
VVNVDSFASVQACDVVAEIAKPEFKARMTVKLAVAGAFHTDYMAPAVGKLKEALANTTMTMPRLPVVSNVDAMPHSDPDVIKDILARQVIYATWPSLLHCCVRLRLAN